MGRLLIFFAALLALSAIGILVWWTWNKVNISIQRRKSVFEIEKEARKEHGWVTVQGADTVVADEK